MVKLSEPIWVVTPLLPRWRRPVSSTVTKEALLNPVFSTSASSARNVSSLAASRRTTWRFEITTPTPFSSAKIRSQVICP